MADCEWEHYYKDTICLPRKDVGTGVRGFAVDFGGTLIKLAYILDKDKDPVTIHFISFPTKNLDDALQFIRKNIIDPLNGKNDPKFFGYSCGVSAIMYRDRIIEALGMELNDTAEFEVFAKGLYYGLTKLPENDFIAYTGYSTSKNFPDKQTPPPDQLMGLALINIKSNAGAQEAAKSPPPQFPCIICFAGSAFAMLKVYDDGSYEALMPIITGGIYFFGLGKLLTGCKNYEELMNMALKGDSSQVSLTAKDFPQASMKQGDLDFTDVFTDEIFTQMGLPLSKVIREGIENPKKEDVANSVLNSFCVDLVMHCAHAARRKGCQRIYLCGSFCKNNKLLPEYVKRLELSEIGYDGPLLAMSLLKYESYIGCIGNVLRAAEDLAKT